MTSEPDKLIQYMRREYSFMMGRVVVLAIERKNVAAQSKPPITRYPGNAYHGVPGYDWHD